jgi:hypothetical protein
MRTPNVQNTNSLELVIYCLLCVRMYVFNNKMASY